MIKKKAGRNRNSTKSDDWKTEMRELKRDIKKYFRWTVAILISMWITIIVSIFWRMQIILTRIVK